MKLIVGLGNPGKLYAVTRHNTGFLVLERLAAETGARFRTDRRFNASIAEAVVGGENCYLAKPQTFMNLSGHPVRLIITRLKIELKEFLVIVDDVVLPFGKIRIRARGSDGGHKGLRSVINCVGSDDFSRIRIGIKGHKDIEDSSKYVLARWTKKEQKALPDILDRAISACECWIREGVDTAMNRYNTRRFE